MKEFALRHPIITFLIVDTVFVSVVNIVNMVGYYKANGKMKKVGDSNEVSSDRV